MRLSLEHLNRGLFTGLLSIAAACALVAMGGCGSGRPKTVPVTGTVTLDAKPVEGASVMFMPEAGGKPAVGVTDKDGRFTLKTFEPGDGALPGKHNVSITKQETTGFTADKDGLSGPPGPGGPKVTWIVPQKYSDAKNSGLTADVKPGMGPLNFDLTAK